VAKKAAGKKPPPAGTPLKGADGEPPVSTPQEEADFNAGFQGAPPK
jgi:hypothetical protein